MESCARQIFGKSEDKRKLEGGRSENRMWSNEILEEDERKGRWNSVRDKNRPRFGSDFTSATQISSTLPPRTEFSFSLIFFITFPPTDC